MHKIALLLGLASIPMFSGCIMMGGMGNAGAVHSGEKRTPHHQREASNDDFTIVLSFPDPTGGATVPIDAWLHTASDHHDLTDVDICLRIRTPEGAIDEIRMPPLHSSAAGIYHAQYSFRTAGLYVVTAEGWVGARDDAPTVSVSIQTEVRSEAHRRSWLAPGAHLGSLIMVVMTVFMMG